MMSKLSQHLSFKRILLLALIGYLAWRYWPQSVKNRPADQPIAAVQGNIMTDPGDGQTYQVIELADGKTWMAENLNYTTKGGSSWTYPDRAYPDSVAEANIHYGRMYTWEAAQKACPNGWHLPSNEEWEEMTDTYGGSVLSSSPGDRDASYEALIHGGSSGFNALLGGYFDNDNNPGFVYVNRRGYYWTSSVTENPEEWEIDEADVGIWGYFFYASRRSLYRAGFARSDGFAVRCVKD